ncbi:DUF3380 domain-containing protein [bacterium]|nr:DUF3380 domain-containing protein [bacterium]NCQ55748.1 DUF3380 domain-containing protein [Candidatus Parcubacteria bacterium]NCS67697.1 DUF3380 domain-containing protein [Candidatus Peregrinibacteria bacterium]NCS96711.1 DUF3380 domain-containing protein [bacterium]
MKKLINRSQEVNTQFIWQETPEGPETVVAPLDATPIEADAPQIEAAAAAAGAKDVTVSHRTLPNAPDIQAEACAIEEDCAHLAEVVEGEVKQVDVTSAKDSTVDGEIDVVETHDEESETIDFYETIPEVKREAADEAIASRIEAAREENPDLTEEEITEIRAEASAEFLANNLRDETLEVFDRDIAAAREMGDEALAASLEAQRAEFEARDVQAEITEAATFLEGTDPAQIVNSYRSSGEPYGPSGSSFGNGVSGTMEGVAEISNSEMLAHCDAVAQQLGVETAAVKAVVSVESAGQMNATRFEPHIHARYPNTPEPTRTQLATSYGAFQIMGFNHEVAGFDSPQSMIDAMATPQGQLQAFAGFIESNPRIHNALRSHDWATFAHGYNGAGYRANRYDEKMAEAYSQFSQEQPST